jgi:ABC-type lipoprotein export system ATPase subunit
VNVSTNNLCFKGYKGNNINNVNIELSTGQCLIISGISGCGKSLLLSLICGLVIADSGSVVFDDLTMQQMTTEQDAQFRKRLGVVFQKPALLSNLTILENLLLPLIQHCPELSDTERGEIVENACQQFNLQSYLNYRVEDLSNGMQSLVSLTRALIGRPDLLIWDAPLADIDLNWSAQIISVLKQMKARRKTMILFTNKEILIDKMADVHLHLVDGELIASDAIGPGKETFNGIGY